MSEDYIFLEIFLLSQKTYKLKETLIEEESRVLRLNFVN